MLDEFTDLLQLKDYGLTRDPRGNSEEKYQAYQPLIMDYNADLNCYKMCSTRHSKHFKGAVKAVM